MFDTRIRTHRFGVRAGSNFIQLLQDRLCGLEQVVVDVLPTEVGGLGAESAWLLRRHERQLHEDSL